MDGMEKITARIQEDADREIAAMNARTDEQIAALQAMDEYLGRGDIGRDGDIVYVAQAQQIHFIGLMGLRADRVSEEEQQVDLVAGDARSDLLVAPMGAGQKTLDAQARGLRHKLARRTCRAQIVLGKHAAVCNTELHHQFLFGVMRNQRNVHKDFPPSLYLLSLIHI